MGIAHSDRVGLCPSRSKVDDEAPSESRVESARDLTMNQAQKGQKNNVIKQEEKKK